MIFRQVLDDDLGCASYLIGDGGEAVVVDPSWDVAPYLELAASRRLRITKVLETHTHADHVSGRGRLVEATGAEVLVPAGAVASFEHSRVADGDVVTVGALRIEAISTPGHRPEHLAFLVTDTSRDCEPTLVLSGDSLLVGDVARPDLATATGPEAWEAARSLHGSIRRLARLEDHVELWPGHIGGSLCCGAATSDRPSSTMGAERRANPGMAAESADRFAGDLLARLPERPPAVDHVVQLNRGPLLRGVDELRSLGFKEVEHLLARGAVIIDGRSAAAFDEASIPGSICLPLGAPGVGSRAAWLVERDRPIVLVAADHAAAGVLARRLGAVGLLDVRGRLAGGVGAWRARGRQAARIERLDAGSAARQLARGSACSSTCATPMNARPARRSRGRCRSRGGSSLVERTRCSQTARRRLSRAPPAPGHRPRRACSRGRTARLSCASRPEASVT